MDSGSKFIVDHLTKKLAEMVWQKGRLLREFGAAWFVEVL